MLWQSFKFALGGFIVGLAVGGLIASYYDVPDANGFALGLASLSAVIAGCASWLILHQIAKHKGRDRRPTGQVQRITDALVSLSAENFSAFRVAAEQIFSRRSPTFYFTTWPESGDYAIFEIMREAGLTGSPQRRHIKGGRAIFYYRLTKLGAKLLPEILSDAQGRRQSRTVHAA